MHLKWCYYVVGLTLIGILIISGCSKNFDEIVDSQGSIPVITLSTITPNVINSDTINVNLVRSPDDTLTPQLFIQTKAFVVDQSDPIKEIRYRVTSPGDNSFYDEGSLFDNGTAPDGQAHDSLYCGWVTLTFQRSLVGTLSVDIVAITEKGFQSTHRIIPLTILRINHPPVISDLNMPDIVYTSEENSFIVTLKVYDPDGLSDIYRVYRLTPAGNKYDLNDVGLNGDITAHNGIYTETVAWGKNDAPTPGNYTFQFFAVDRSLDTSNVLTHTVVIQQ
ncbi:MAG TPA: hypothetical protein PK595_00650 [Bacteroidota bacterium]|nr:hypothetical protein [Bacteroidota bacterium]